MHLQVSDSYWHQTKTKETLMSKGLCSRKKKKKNRLTLLSPCQPVPDRSARENWALTLVPHLFFSFSGTQYSDQGHLRCSPNAAFAPPLSGSHGGDGQGWEMPTCLGRRGGKAFFIQNKHCVFPQCNNLLWLVHGGSRSGLSQSLLPSLLNHVTASFSY